jgi:hypothetical protein
MSYSIENENIIRVDSEGVHWTFVKWEGSDGCDVLASREGRDGSLKMFTIGEWIDLRIVAEKLQSKPPNDPVNHPKHYTSHPSGIECIQITEHMNFNLGNAIKYLWRNGDKNGIEDLKKAVWYIQREIERLTRSEG